MCQIKIRKLYPPANKKKKSSYLILNNFVGKLPKRIAFFPHKDREQTAICRKLGSLMLLQTLCWRGCVSFTP